MSKFLFAILLFLSMSYCLPLRIGVATNNPTQFYLGEKVFIAVTIDGATGDGLEEGHRGTAPYILKNVTGNSASWLKPNGRPEYNPLVDNANEHWQNNQGLWLELSGFAPATGNYLVKFRVVNTTTNDSADMTSSFTVVAPPYVNSGVAVAMHDSAASYGRQKELYTSLKNIATTARSLQSPYIDYYGSRANNAQPVINVWDKPSNGCVQVLQCGTNNFIIRHRFSGEVSLDSGRQSAEFRIGYNEATKADNPNYFVGLPEKNKTTFLNIQRGYNSITGTNIYSDYSYAENALSYLTRAKQRNLFYNPVEVLYDHEDNPLWGTPPDWYSKENCSIVRITELTEFNWQKFRTNDVSGFCTDDMVNSAPTIQFPNEGPDTLYEGEDYFLRPIVTDTDGDHFSLEILDNNPAWLEVGTPANYWDDYQDVINNNVNTSINRRVVYIRSVNNHIRKSTTITPGTYTYAIKVTDSFGASSTAYRTIVVQDGATHLHHTESGLAVLVGDETWFKKYQLDVASGLVNYSGTSRTLSSGWHYDYYGRYAELTTLPTAHFWYTDPNVNVSYNGCGDKRFRVRYTGTSGLTINSNHSEQDSKVGFYRAIGQRLIKNDDWSIENFYTAGDTLRRRRYAPKAVLYDGNGDLLWGEVPEWASDCDNPFPSSSSNDPISGSSASEDLSSSSFNPYTDLAARFKDISVETNVASFGFDVLNKGNVEAEIGGYEIHFYYNGNESLDASTIAFDTVLTYAKLASWTKEQCAENLFVFKMKFADSAKIAPASAIPYAPMLFVVHQENWLNYDWTNFASWMNALQMTENPQMALFDSIGNLIYGTEKWACEGFIRKQLKLSVFESVNPEYYILPNSIGHINVEIKNAGDSSLIGPSYVDFYVKHPAGQVPMIVVDAETLSVANTWLNIGEGKSVIRMTSGNLHVFRFAIAGGLAERDSTGFSFYLLDQCIMDCPAGSEDFYTWNLFDDWSAQDGAISPWISVKTDKIVIYDSAGNLVYGKPDPSASISYMPLLDESPSFAVNSYTSISSSISNRTDAILYSGGQLLSGGNFETDWLQGWFLSDSATSIRGNSPQGSRHIKLSSGASLAQELPPQAGKMLTDSGATLMLWHKGSLSINITKNDVSVYMDTLSSSNMWKQSSLIFLDTLFDAEGIYSLTLSAINDAFLDDAVLIPSSAPRPVNYAVRFTSPAGEELESRIYDGAEELLITDSEQDAMGRTWKKYLPFALPCKGAADCNSERKTAHNPGMAKNFYTAANPNYPDAQDVPYTETKWKSDPMATVDVIGAPGKAYSTDSTHLVRSYSSGVNLTGINILDSASLNSAISAEPKGRSYDGNETYRPLLDVDPTHLWELNLDQDGLRAFTVKDGEGHVIVSGSLDSTGTLLTRSVNELDSRGNVVKSHPPMSCEYVNPSANCVSPSTFEYDAQSRLVKKWEPDAGETRNYYDLAGRLRATQTQRQIDSRAFSVIGYDHLDRPVYTGEWKTALDSGAVREYFDNVQNQYNPTVAELTPGTVTRTFYDRMPARDTLGVLLYPASVQADAFRYGRTRVMAVISDVSADDSGNVARVSTANTYDKYGRVVASYTYDPTMPADSLKMLAVETEYDLGGKVTKTRKYPYGLSTGGANRKIEERYIYDRLGRVDSVFSKNGSGDEMLIAHYTYYPTGNVKNIVMGNTLTLTYTYHISGAVKSARVTTANGAELYSQTLYYEDCGDGDCKPRYNGNISYMAHRLAHDNRNFVQIRNVAYTYDQLNRLTKTDDFDQDYFDESFAYDAQGRIAAQRRYDRADSSNGGEYSYYGGTNKLKSVADNMGGSTSYRTMSANDNFAYDRDGNLVEDKSKQMRIAYDWRGMPVEFARNTDGGDSLKLVMKYDGSGRRISKTYARKVGGEWDTVKVTHYTGIGTEIREEFAAAAAGTKVVVPMPQGLGRYGIENASSPTSGDKAFEWYLKNHLGSTMAVYGTTGTASSPELKHAYDYRSFGEQIELTPPSTGKVTENFTGKEKDDETELNYFGARYLDPMLGMWISVDADRQFASPYLYVGNGVNPVNAIDPDGNETTIDLDENNKVTNMTYTANDNTTVTFNKPGVDPFTAAEPPLQSYFFDKNEDGSFKNVGAVFDACMDNNAQSLLKTANDLYPLKDIKQWGTGGNLDFKNKFYNENVRTIGILNGTVMTPRDAGNAIWGGWTREKYYTPYFFQRALSNGYAVYKQGKFEDTQSSVMQIWGFGNYKPQ